MPSVSPLTSSLHPRARGCPVKFTPIYSLTKAGRESQVCTKQVENRVNSISWLRERTRLRAHNLNKYQLYGAIKTISRDLSLPQQWLWGCRFLGYEGMKPDRNPSKFRSNLHLHLQYFPATWVNFYHTTRSHILADYGLQEYFHLSSSPHSAIKIYRVIMPKSDTVVSITVRSVNQYSIPVSTIMSYRHHVQTDFKSPLILSPSGNLKSFLGSEQPEHKDTHSGTASIK
jgi:hypothetical protein